MDHKPLFSVVIPTYNREGLIVKTLNTVFQQTYPHYEIIVVDNCSTDQTEQVLEPLIKAGQIQFIKHDRNYERARSRNTGMDAARGDFVTLLDSDDYMYPNNLQDAADFAFKNPETRIFHNLYQLVDPGNNVLYKYRFPTLTNPIRAIADGNFLSCIGVFIHREIYDRYRFDTNPVLSGSEDWEYWMRIIADYKVGRISKINNGVVHHSGRTVANIDLDKLRRRLDYIIEKFSTDPHLHSVYRDYIKRVEVSSLIYMASVANSARQFTEARKFLREAYEKDKRVAASLKFLRVLQIATLKMDKGL